MRQVAVRIAISAEEFQRLYQGSARDVLAYSLDGRRIKFPASILRPFVTHTGISGQFQINFDEDNRFQSIERLG